MDWYRLLPAYWYQKGRTFGPWDQALSEALSVYGVSEVGAHTCKVGRFTVWISNYPYNFGYRDGDPLELLPSVQTRRKLRRAIEQWYRASYRGEPADGAFPPGTTNRVASLLRAAAAGIAFGALAGVGFFIGYYVIWRHL